ncbi:PepSY-associated TM helix domain-containing protein [Bordetella genomosp. 12]|uniref:Peptidase n=1 Tax=Bordetella genomosp. 12 TaxID=463035 RepID=A0A261VCJ0_9BORD|nr:PepSY-associated TM helix domain-containing protein [Bordetella genomosp. 12]OZI71547.1 peptidase [Bordetella genomosp. 12]
MKPGLRQRMSWLHTWCGLIGAWLLCLIFLAGSLSVFRAPISRWMDAEPPLPLTQAQLPQDAVLTSAARYLASQDAHARFWRIELPGETSRAMRLVWRSASGATHEAAMDPRDGTLLPQPWGRKTEGGRHFMTLHYTLLAGNTGFWLVGALTIAMLVALLSGIIVHKRIFKDFFTFRPGPGQRAWLDGHNASAVLTLPFQLMIAYTGLAIFYTSYMPAPLRAVYGEQGLAQWQADLAREADSGQAGRLPARPALQAGPPVREQLGPLVLTAQAALSSPARMIMVERPGQARERISIYAQPDPEQMRRQLTSPAGRMVFDGASGAPVLLAAGQPAPDAAHEVMERLHVATYGGWTIKWLYFLCGMAGAIMMASGAILFALKRRNKPEYEFGAATQAFYRLTDALNVAAIAGACLACIAYFYANRLIPADLPGRDIWEIRAFMLVWLLSLAHACLRAPERAWTEQFACTALLCLLLPVLNAGVTGQHVIGYAQRHEWQAALVEVTALMFGGLFAGLAWRLRRIPHKTRKAPRPVALPRGYRWQVLGRALCAVLGGYALSSLAATLLARTLPLSTATSPAMGVVIGSLLSFLMYALAALWVFAARRAWLWLVLTTAAAAALAWMLQRS